MTPGQLVSAVSIALDVPRETVFQHDRNLVVAGLRTFGGRGRNAPTVTHLDAARLVAAILGSVRVLDSVETVLECERVETFGSDAKGLQFFSPAKLPEEHNFIQALAAIIEDADTPLMFEDFDEYVRRFLGLSVELNIPMFGGLITLSQTDFEEPRTTTPIARMLKRVTWKRPKTDNRGIAYASPILLKHILAVAEQKTSRDRLLLSGGIHQERKIGGSAVMLIGRAFQENGLSFDSRKEALAAWPETSAGKKQSAKKAAD